MEFNERFNIFTRDFNRFKNKNIYSGCIFENEDCSDKIVKAHSIQNNRILNELSENGMVLQFSVNEMGQYGMFDIDKIGRKKATTFTGFCGYHDKVLFKPIEDFDYSPKNLEQEFLFAFRAICKEYHSKKTAINIYREMIKMLDKNDINVIKNNFSCIKDVENLSIKQGYPFFKLIEEFEDISLNDLEKNIDQMKSSLLKNKYEDITTNVLEFDTNYNIAVSSIFNITKDLNGNIVNNIYSKTDLMCPIMLTVIPQNSKTYVLMSYFTDHATKLNFIESQILNKSEEEQKIIISNMIVMYCENFVLSPRKWDDMNNDEKENMIKLFNETLFEQNDLLTKRRFNFFE